MNILFVSPEIPYPPIGGHYLRTYNVLKLLSENHRIFFIGFVKDKEELEFKKDFKKLCESFDVFFIQEDDFSFRFWLKVIRNLLSPYPYIKHKYYNKNASRRIREILSEGQIDLVHLDMLPMSTYYSDLNSTPTILTNHNVESVRLHRWIQVEKNIFIKSFLAYQYIKLRSYEKKMCPKFDKCVTVSSEDEKVLKKLCKSDNFAVIPNGVDIEYFKPLEGPIVPNRLIWVGGMSGPYNSDAVDYFLDEILPLIRAKKPEVEVDFVGGYPTKKLKQQELKNSHIKLHGFVDDTRPLVQKAAVFIAPIRSGSGTKIKVLNAMSLAKPVVTTSVGAEGISVEADKNIIIADDPKVFAEKTVYLLNNQHIANEMGMAGRKIIEKYYDWNVIKENMEQLYNEVKLLRFQ
jgi:glycosyltransferase involved in cell wall biosynthesis